MASCPFLVCLLNVLFCFILLLSPLFIPVAAPPYSSPGPAQRRRYYYHHRQSRGNCVPFASPRSDKGSGTILYITLVMSWGIEMINRVSLVMLLHQMWQDQDGGQSWYSTV
jgi:hypothetical protein